MQNNLHRAIEPDAEQPERGRLALRDVTGGGNAADAPAALLAAKDAIGAYTCVDTIGDAPTGNSKNLRDMVGDVGDAVVVEGFHATGDGGGGIFFWSTSGSDDGGTFIVPRSLGPSHSNKYFSVRNAAGWRRLYSGPLNVKWFGAKGNGFNDDTSAIQNALNVAKNQSHNASVYIPAGYYNIYATLKIAPSAGLSLLGDGAVNTALAWRNRKSDGSAMLEVPNTWLTTVAGLRFVGNHVARYGIRVRGAADTHLPDPTTVIERCWFYELRSGIAYTADREEHGDNGSSEVRNCTFSKCSDSGIRYGHSNRAVHKIVSCGFDRCRAGVSNLPLDAFSEGGKFSAQGCDFSDNVFAFEVSPGQHMMNISDCYVEGGTWFMRNSKANQHRRHGG